MKDILIIGVSGFLGKDIVQSLITNVNNKEILLKLYYLLPPFLKSFIASIIGFNQKKIRYGGKYSRFVDELRKNQNLNKSEMEFLVEKKLRNILIHSFNNVEYYNELFQKMNLNPTAEDPFKLLNKLPILNKESVRKNPEKFVSNILNKYIITHTSGSTGTPLKLYLSYEAIQYNYALATARQLDWVNVKHEDKKVMFGGQLVTKINKKNPPYWVSNYFEKQLYCSSYHLSKNTFNDYYNEIKNYKPKYITGYTSAIYLFSKYLIDSGNEIIGIKAILPSSETLSDRQREVMENAFNCKVYDGYSLSEYVNYITECSSGSMHVSPEAGIVNILDDENKEQKKGEVGRLISTTLFNYSMPLIKYDTGDLAIANDKVCNCGIELPVIDKIIGRQDDYAIAFDGSKVGRLDPVFKNVNGVIEAQIIQKVHGEIEVLVVPSINFSKKEEDIIIKNLKMRLGKEMNININKSHMIKRNHNGKFKSVICNIK